MATRETVQRVKDDIPQLVAHIMKDEGTNTELFKERTVKLLGGLPALELFPGFDKLDHEEQFSTYYDDKLVEWDMAAPNQDFSRERR